MNIPLPMIACLTVVAAVWLLANAWNTDGPEGLPRGCGFTLLALGLIFWLGWSLHR